MAVMTESLMTVADFDIVMVHLRGTWLGVRVAFPAADLAGYLMGSVIVVSGGDRCT